MQRCAPGKLRGSTREMPLNSHAAVQMKYDAGTCWSRGEQHTRWGPPKRTKRNHGKSTDSSANNFRETVSVNVSPGGLGGRLDSHQAHDIAMIRVRLTHVSAIVTMLWTILEHAHADYVW